MTMRLYFAKTEILLKVFLKKAIINPGSMMNGSIAEELNENTNLFNSLIKRVEVLTAKEANIFSSPLELKN